MFNTVAVVGGGNSEHSPLREATPGPLPTQAAAAPAKNVAAAPTTFPARWKNRSVRAEVTKKQNKPLTSRQPGQTFHKMT